MNPDLARAEVMLDQQQALAAWFTTRTGETFMGGILETLQTTALAREYGTTGVARMVASRLRAAETFYVTPEMVDVIAALMPKLPPLDLPDVDGWHLAPPDLFPTGWVQLGKPLRTIDARGQVMCLSGMLWNRATITSEGNPTVGDILIFTDITHPEDSLRTEVEPEKYAKLLDLMGPIAKTALAHMIPIPTPDALASIDVRQTRSAYGRTRPGGYRNVWDAYPELAFLVVLWSLLTSRIARPDRRTVDRHARRRWERAGMTGAPEVTIVDLRREDRGPASPDSTDREPGSGPVWSHRWVVAAHYRWQPYGPGRRLRRLVLIEPYVKGPEHLPIIARDRVYRVRR